MPRPAVRRFVGRASEMARLTAIVDSAAGGTAGVAVVSGDAGVGKTRLLEELANRSRAAGHAVLVGACVQFGDFALPYVPIVDALHALEASPEGASLLRAEAARRPVLSRLLPHLTDPTDAARTGHDLAEGLAQVQLFDAIHGIVVALAETAPVLFVIEDLHWADRSTRDLIAFLGRTLRSDRVALVVSYRSEDVNRRHPLRPLLAELARRPDVELVEMSGFSQAEVAELLENTTDGPIDPQLLDRVFARSEGNAFFAEELLRASARPHQGVLPEALVDVLLSRVEALQEDSRRTLQLAAVSGRRTTHDLLIEAAGTDPDLTERALRDAVDAGLLVNVGDTYAFRHALLQEAVYGDLLPGERIRLHARFAELLETRREAEGAASTVSMAELAHHRLASRDFPRAFAALVAAARESEEFAAPAEALHHLEEALGIIGAVDAVDAGGNRLDLLLRATDAAAASGDPARAVVHGVAAVAAADVAGDVGARARARELLARVQMENGERATAASGQAVELLRELPASGLLARSLATHGRALLYLESGRAEEFLNEAITIAESMGADAIAADALVSRAIMVIRGRIAGDAENLLARAVSRAAAAPDGLAIELRARRFQSVHLLDLGRIAETLTLATEGVERSERAGLSWSSYGLDLQLIRGWALAAAGEWDDVLRASLDAAYAPTSPGRVLATQALAVLVARGDPTAGDLLRRLRGTGDIWGEFQLDTNEIDLLLQQDNPAGALAIVEHSLAQHGDRYRGHTEAVLLAAKAAAAHAALAVIARRAGDPATAHAHAVAANGFVDEAQVNAAARPSRPPAIWLWVQWAIAEAAEAAGEPAGDEWAAVIAEADRSGRVADAAAARLRFAESALEAGDRGDDTIAALRDALSVASRLRAQPLLTRAHDLARRARLETELGLPTALPSSTKNLTLTAREAEVLKLVTDGLTNRQIGRALFISEKTASVHVSNILGKLGAATRTEAAALARQQGLLAG